MITKIFLLCATLAQVSSNPLLQALAQTCPICQQNALKNPLAAALPMFQPSQNQAYPQGIVSESPWPALGPMCQPNNQYCQCPPNKCRQQSPCPPQNARNSNNQANSDIINKLLSNPTLRSLLDPKANLFTQNVAEVPKTRQCKNGAPNIINNYIIVPPELLLEDAKCIPKEDKKLKEERRGRNEQRRRRPSQIGRREEHSKKPTSTDVVIPLTPIKENPRSRAVQDEDKGNHKSPGKEDDGHINENSTDPARKRKRRRRKKNRNPNVKVEIVSKNDTETNYLTETPSPNKIEKTAETTTTETNILEPKTNDYPQNYENIKQTSEIYTELRKDGASQSSENTSPIFVSRPNGDIETTSTEKDADSIVEIQIQSPQEMSTEKPKSQNQHLYSHRKEVVNNKHLREERVIADFKRKFPNIPENVVRDLIDHMAREIESQNLGNSMYYSQHLINHEQPSEKHLNQDATIPVHINNKQYKRKNDNFHRNRPKKLNAIENTTIFKTTTEIADSKHHTESTTTTTTTGKPTTIAPLIKTTIKPEILTVTTDHAKEIELIEPTTLKPLEELRSIKDVYPNNFNKYDKIPELGTEDVVPIFYVTGLDEYYPDFTADNQYFSYEDYSYLRPEEDRYYYTTDKNYALQELNRERRTYENPFENNARAPENRFFFKVRKNNRGRPNYNKRRRPTSKAIITTTMRTKSSQATTESPKIIVNVEQSTEKAQEIEEIQFKTPPTLKMIDFETKPVNKNFYFRDDDYKISTYSDFKTPQYNMNNKSDSIGSTQKPADKIETVYAKSKVVKYGQPQSRDGFKIFDLVNDNNSFPTEDKTLVMAKSVPDDFW